MASPGVHGALSVLRAVHRHSREMQNSAFRGGITPGVALLPLRQLRILQSIVRDPTSLAGGFRSLLRYGSAGVT
jgi:hypothetical protein